MSAMRQLMYGEEQRMCSCCAQGHLTPAHSRLLQPKFEIRRNPGPSGPEWVGMGWTRVVKTVS